MSTIQTLNSAYGFTQALLNIFPRPIVARRVPATTDKAQIGTVWVDSVGNNAFVLTSIVNNVASWQGLAGGGALTSLTVTPGPVSLAGTTTINTAGAAVTTIGTGGTGAVNIGNTTGNVAVTGQLTASTGLVATTGGIMATAGGLNATGTTNINVAGAAVTTIGTGGTGAVNIGNATGNTSVVGSLAATGNITSQAGNVVIATATHGVTLPGPINIISGAGAPAGGLALHIGDMYINTSAATAATRVYVATAIGAWTNLTAAA